MQNPERYPFTAKQRTQLEADDHPLTGWLVYEPITKTEGVIDFVVDGVAIIVVAGTTPSIHRIAIALADMTIRDRRVKLFPNREALEMHIEAYGRPA